jgi:3',5'-cyclic AMP phosphodiesterase CpdA
LRKRTCIVAILPAILSALWILRLATAAEEFKPFVFVHVGDPELGKPDLKSTAERFALFAQRANTLGAELAIVAGDLLHDQTEEHLKAFQDCLKQFRMPVKMVPGNHDDPRLFEKHFGPRRYVFTHNNCEFICLDSNDLLAHSEPSDPKCKELLDWLEAALANSERQRRTHTFVVMHHPIADQAPLEDLLAKHRIAGVLSGHLHMTREIRAKGFTIYVAPSTARFRDDKGVGYRIFKVFQDRIEQEAVPLAKEVGKGGANPEAKP